VTPPAIPERLVQLPPTFSLRDKLSWAAAVNKLRNPTRASGIGLSKKFFQLVSGYDNGCGCSCRTVDLLKKIGKSL
jgi:hypothetical protein